LEPEHISLGYGRGGFVVRSNPTTSLSSRAGRSSGSPDVGDHSEASQLTGSVPKLDEHDTQGTIALCDQARHTARPERDRVISHIFALKLDRCPPKALDAIELLIYDLIANDTE
jgi:hypothetical protein